MNETKTATVEVLTAAVRVLMVGSRQVTLSVFRQLDIVDRTDAFQPLGRINEKVEDNFVPTRFKQKYNELAAALPKSTITKSGSIPDRYNVIASDASSGTTEKVTHPGISWSVDLEIGQVADRAESVWKQNSCQALWVIGSFNGVLARTRQYWKSPKIFRVDICREYAVGHIDFATEKLIRQDGKPPTHIFEWLTSAKYIFPELHTYGDTSEIPLIVLAGLK